MARFSGVVGYAVDTVETPSGSGKWVDQIQEVTYQGDVVRNVRNIIKSDKVNDDITISHSISIIADQNVIEHFTKIKYVRWMGVPWTVDSVEVRSPRLILNLGSVYHGPTL